MNPLFTIQFIKFIYFKNLNNILGNVIRSNININVSKHSFLSFTVLDLFNPSEYSAFMESNAYPHIRRLLSG